VGARLLRGSEWDVDSVWTTQVFAALVGRTRGSRRLQLSQLEGGEVRRWGSADGGRPAPWSTPRRDKASTFKR